MPYALEVYADGACRRNGQHNAAAGAGVYFPRPLNRSHGFSRALPSHPTPTNQRAELSALILALELAIDRRNQLKNRPFFALTIHIDSQYAIDCLTKWLGTWERNGWRTFSGAPVQNRDLIQQAASLMDEIATNHGNVTFQWISRDKNINADYAANQACDEAELALNQQQQRSGYYHSYY
uniref:ribonuclease H n=1 Tax=Mycena chlorophos TaxID=658473 RepID=A0ABQ0LUM0_MYCCL|nr:ribonuclease H1 [Mycena chlorophos]